MSDYKPTGTLFALLSLPSPYTDIPSPIEHDGLRKDGQPDKRVGTGEFAQGKVDPHEAGKKGGHASGGSGNDDGADSTGNEGGNGGKGQFAGGKVDPVEAGRKGGNSSS